MPEGHTDFYFRGFRMQCTQAIYAQLYSYWIKYNKTLTLLYFLEKKTGNAVDLFGFGFGYF
jgi:hypothetical protein